ncbi:MAG: glycosyltransferase family 9 protein, partial [Rhodospirillales bacterium]
KQWPDHEILLLTNEPVADNAAPMMQLLDGEPGIAGYLAFPAGLDLFSGLALLRLLRAAGADRLVYLSEPGSFWSVCRDGLFFRLFAGLPVTGLPLRAENRRYLKHTDDCWERETDRLVRVCRLPTGPDDGSHRLHLHEDELKTGRQIRRAATGDSRFIAFAPAGKTADKDWGDDRWEAVLSVLTSAYPDLGLVLIGAAADREKLAGYAGHWTGPAGNLCGMLSPRLSAAAMIGAELFLGVDSGPMHLAAAADIPCVAVFSARAKPGVWYPAGTGHRIHYPGAHAAAVPAIPGAYDGGRSIRDIPAADVIASVRDLLDNH